MSQNKNTKPQISSIPSFREDVDQSVLQQIAGILGIPITRDWGVIGEPSDRNRDDLYMLHYTNSANIDYFGWIRGVVVSVKHRVIVADSYGYTPHTVVPFVTPDAEGFITFVDNDNKSYTIHSSEAVFRYGCEGFMVRTFKWNGIVYKVSHRSFNIDNSRWGDSLPFGQIYQMMGGPEDDELFDPQEKFSPYVHFFMCQHPTMLQVTNNEPGNGLLYYLSFRLMWPLAPVECPFRYTGINDNPMLMVDQTLEDWNNSVFGGITIPKPLVGYISLEPMAIKRRLTIPTLEEEKERLGSARRPEVVHLSTMTVPQVNELLKNGYVKFKKDNLNEVIDPRWGTGEFVVLYLPDGGLLTVRSIAYDWRSNLLNQNPNRRNQFYKLIYEANILRTDPKAHRAALKDFRAAWPKTIKRPMAEVRAMLEQGPLRIWDSRPVEEINPDEIDSVRSYRDRVYCIWVNFLISAPYNRQMEIFKLYDAYFADLDTLTNWICENKDKFVEEMKENRNFTFKWVDIHNVLKFNLSQTGEKFKKGVYESLILYNGTRLYGMVREMEISQQLAALSKVTSANAANAAKSSDVVNTVVEVDSVVNTVVDTVEVVV